MSRLQDRAQEMMARHGFLGVPLETFEQGGREQLIALLNEGLTPESKVLDIGCGCLRVAYWLIRFLDPGCYFGIEPASVRVDYGLRYLFAPEEIEGKRPHFDFNANFDSSVFGVKFDFFLAGSIWTHASKRQVEATLDGFVRDSTAKGIFLASYLPARSLEEVYEGDRWVGTSHESDTPGVIRHSLEWIVQQCEARGLAVRELPGLDCDSQSWLRISYRSDEGVDQ
jgi:SAM-dependent methyltransferase